MISLAMIVRDEEAMLPRFFAAAAGLADELVVVDTGSRDTTVAMARAAGACVIERAWDDDFSAARNAGLAHARGDWVVVLDADEMATPELVREIRALESDDAAGAATLVMRNNLPNGHVRESHLLRVWRNDPTVRFRHRIHEEATTTVHEMLARTGRALRHLAGRVVHLGYEKERALEKNKRARDVTLLEQCVAADPRDFYSWFKLLEVARFWSDDRLGRDAARRARAALDAAPADVLAGAPFAGDFLVLLSEGLVDRSDTAGALAFLDLPGKTMAPSAALSLRRGELCERLGQGVRAEQEFRRCFDLAPGTANQQLATVRPALGLARLALARGDTAAAWTSIEHALAWNPRDREALVAALFVARAQGGVQRAVAFTAAHRMRHGPSVELDGASADVLGARTAG